MKTHPTFIKLLAMSPARKAALLLFSIVALAVTAHAQTALDGFDPNANNIVRVVVRQPDGKILIGGAFTTVAPNGGATVTRNRIARFNPDGSLDTAFNPNANNEVLFIALQPDGKILVGGNFNGANSIGGAARNRMARLDTNGVADSFNPNANGGVLAIAVQPDGKILAGGGFDRIGGTNRIRIARLDSTTGLADAFNPAPTNSGAVTLVNKIVLQADGKVLVGGNFVSLGGAARNYIARLDGSTGLADAFNPNANNGVFAIAVQPDGKVLVGGAFNGANSIGGMTRNRIARLNATTGAADSFNPNANETVWSLTLQGDGKVWAAGNFFTVGGQAHNGIARLDPITGAPDSFDAHADNTVYSLALQPDGGIIVGGAFTQVAVGAGPIVTRNRVARFGTPLPRLNIQRGANTNVVLSWATNFPGFTLEFKTNLSTTIWGVVSPAPSTSGTNNVVTNAASGSARFYRLRKP